jgi:hypothetical protein
MLLSWLARALCVGVLDRVPLRHRARFVAPLLRELLFELRRLLCRIGLKQRLGFSTHVWFAREDRLPLFCLSPRGEPRAQRLALRLGFGVLARRQRGRIARLLLAEAACGVEVGVLPVCAARLGRDRLRVIAAQLGLECGALCLALSFDHG